MNKREALKFIEQKTKEGSTQKEIYDELSGKYNYRPNPLHLIAMVPTQEVRQRYNKYNLLLFGLLVLVSLVKILEITLVLLNISIYTLPFVFFAASISIFFITMVWKFRGNIYRILGLLGIAGFFKSLSLLDNYSSYNSIEWSLVILLGYIPALAIIFLSFYIGFKAFPHYSFWGELQTKKLGI